MISQPVVLRAISQKAAEAFPKRFKHELTWLTTK
jgi:hypothetical protein